MMNIDPALPALVGLSLVILLVGLLIRILKQPYVVAYIIAGVLVGPQVFKLITDESVISRLGSIGIVLLLFFVGIEVHLPRLLSSWRVAIFGTLFQILASVGVVWLIGWKFAWPLERIILMGFVISLSSTAVVLKILDEWKETDTKCGQNVVGVLLVQDLAIVPMLLLLSFLGGHKASIQQISLQVVGGIFLILLMSWIIRKKEFRLPFSRKLGKDHEMQVFYALILCFGMALLTGLLGLSTALGAFFAGIIVSATKETQWVHESINSFRVVFVALFFISIGMLIDLDFLWNHLLTISLLVLAVIITNTFINAVILKVLKNSWKESLYSGSLLSQIGEFSFLLAAIGFEAGIISQFAHQSTILVIALTLFLSPAWIMLIKSIFLGGTQRNSVLTY